MFAIRCWCANLSLCRTSAAEKGSSRRAYHFCAGTFPEREDSGPSPRVHASATLGEKFLPVVTTGQKLLPDEGSRDTIVGKPTNFLPSPLG